MPGTILAGRYELLRRIGTGSAGTVWAVRSQLPPHQRQVVKVFAASLQPGGDDTDLWRLLKRYSQGTAWPQFHHPDVAMTFGVVQDRSIRFAVAEHVHGDTLATRLAREGALALDDVVRVAWHAGQALAAAHAVRIAHEDLWVGNVMLTSEGSVKLMDLGFSTAARLLRQRHGVLSVPDRCFPPEGRWLREVGPSADVHALAILVHRIHAGARPLEGAFLGGDFPDDVARLWRDALRADPSKRPEAELLAEAMRSLDPTASHPPPPTRSTRSAAPLRGDHGGAITTVAHPRPRSPRESSVRAHVKVPGLSRAARGVGEVRPPGLPRHRLDRRIVAASLAFLLLATVGTVFDAYRQSVGIYGAVRAVLPRLEEARTSLDLAQAPPSRVLDGTVAGAQKAAQAIAATDFSFGLVGSVPMLGRPVIAARLGVVAVTEEAMAVRIVRGLMLDLLGNVATAAPTSPGRVPVYSDGKVDLKLIQDVVPRLRILLSHLLAADAAIKQIPGSLFVPSLTELKTKAEADSAQAVRLARRTLFGAELLPSFLGQQETRTYLVALQDRTGRPREGPSVLAYAILTVKQGTLSLGRVRTSDVAAFSASLGRTTGGAGDDQAFPALARAWTRTFERASGRRVDGAIAVDPFAIAAILQGQPPIRASAYPGLISAANVVQVMEHDRFLLPEKQLKSLPPQLLEGVFEAILHPHDFLDMLHGLSSAAAGLHLQMWAAAPEQQQLIEQLGWGGP